MVYKSKIRSNSHRRIFIVVILIDLLTASCSILSLNRRPIIDEKAKATKNLKSSNLSQPTNAYKQLISSSAVSEKGMFSVHKVGLKYYFEIPDSLLERDILLITRLKQANADVRPINGLLGYNGDRISEGIIRFSKGGLNKLFIRKVSYTEQSTDTTANGMAHSLANSTLQPIVASFEVKAFSKDSLSMIIEATEFLNSENPLLYFKPSDKSVYNLGAYQADKSYLKSIKSFSENVEIDAVKTFMATASTFTYEFSCSLVLLPIKIMKPRLADDRIGYITSDHWDFDSQQGVKNVSFITRFRLEPKDEDLKRYRGGELVVPKKPIVFFIDPATPKKWIPYLIAGVEAWRPAFEKAGFKNAICATEVPKDDPYFNIYDAKHNAIIFKASTTEATRTRRIVDPRSGEILESHIDWFSNVFVTLQDEYLLQAAINDPRARSQNFEENITGKLIQAVCTSQVGASLGLQLNFGASNTVVLDSLRSKSYLTKSGMSPSILDPVWVNYVVQPQDSIPVDLLLPKIGMYDKWAIEWGYKFLPEFQLPADETQFLDKWIINRTNADKYLWFGQPYGLSVTDPRCQIFDLGNDPIKASGLGISNLKKLMPKMISWTTSADNNFDYLTKIYNKAFALYGRYINHVAYYLGGTTFTPKHQGENGEIIGGVSAAIQKGSMDFLQDNLFETPSWLLNKKIIGLTGVNPQLLLGNIQSELIGRMTSVRFYDKMEALDYLQPTEIYNFDCLLSDLEKGIFKELKNSTPIDFYRRSLQKNYAVQLIQITTYDPANAPFYALNYAKPEYNASLRSDFYPVILTHLKKLLVLIDKALPRYRDLETRRHLAYISKQLKTAINLK